MASELVKEFTAANFGAEVEKSASPVLVDFWAEWCGPCKAIAPLLDEIAKENQGKLVVGKVNIDHEQPLASKYGITSIPTLLLIKGGMVKEQIVGMKSKRDLVAQISKHF